MHPSTHNRCIFFHVLFSLLRCLTCTSKINIHGRDSDSEATEGCSILPRKAKRQYLLTCKVCRYCLLALHCSKVTAAGRGTLTCREQCSTLSSQRYINLSQFCISDINYVCQIIAMLCSVVTRLIHKPYKRYISYFIKILAQLNLCSADTIHNFKSVEIIQIFVKSKAK